MVPWRSSVRCQAVSDLSQRDRRASPDQLSGRVPRYEAGVELELGGRRTGKPLVQLFSLPLGPENRVNATMDC